MSRLYYSYRPRSPSPLRNCIASQSKPYEPDLDVPKDRSKKERPEREAPEIELRKIVMVEESYRVAFRTAKAFVCQPANYKSPSPKSPQDQAITKRSAPELTQLELVKGRKRNFRETREDAVVETGVLEEPRLSRKRVYTDERRRARKRVCTDVDFYLRPLRPCTFFQ